MQALEREGVGRVFAYPGGASMEIHQALTRSPTIRNILCRHEQACACLKPLSALHPTAKGVLLGRQDVLPVWLLHLLSQRGAKMLSFTSRSCGTPWCQLQWQDRGRCGSGWPGPFFVVFIQAHRPLSNDNLACAVHALLQVLVSKA